MCLCRRGTDRGTGYMSTGTAGGKTWTASGAAKINKRIACIGLGSLLTQARLRRAIAAFAKVDSCFA